MPQTIHADQANMATTGGSVVVHDHRTITHAITHVYPTKPSTLPLCKEFQRPQANPDFVGRAKIQSQMVEVLPVEATSEVSSQTMILTTHGMGGVGKTQLAQYHYLNTQYPYSLKLGFMRTVEMFSHQLS